MLLNQHTIISGNLVLLVPYEEYHVTKYHNWMKSAELQLLTASEPLTLEEEYNMQKTWKIDPKKCTFIILDKKVFQMYKNEINAMVGDINLYLNDVNGRIAAEVGVMIAENSARGKGLGKEALLLMLRYGIENLNITTYQAKIGSSNQKSILLFEKMGFEKKFESKIFMEITLEKSITESWIEWIKSQTKFYCKEERQKLCSHVNTDGLNCNKQ